MALQPRFVVALQGGHAARTPAAYCSIAVGKRASDRASTRAPKVSCRRGRSWLDARDGAEAPVGVRRPRRVHCRRNQALLAQGRMIAVDRIIARRDGNLL